MTSVIDPQLLVLARAIIACENRSRPRVGTPYCWACAEESTRGQSICDACAPRVILTLAKALVDGQAPASFTCPECKRTSYNPNDIAHGYCGSCHK